MAKLTKKQSKAWAEFTSALRKKRELAQGTSGAYLALNGACIGLAILDFNLPAEDQSVEVATAVTASGVVKERYFPHTAGEELDSILSGLEVVAPVTKKPTERQVLGILSRLVIAQRGTTWGALDVQEREMVAVAGRKIMKLIGK